VRGFNTLPGTWFPLCRSVYAWGPRRCGGRAAPEQNAALADYLASKQEVAMGFGRGALLWLLGVPLPIVLLLALFMHH
jgi:hypothetical protein